MIKDDQVKYHLQILSLLLDPEENSHKDSAKVSLLKSSATTGVSIQLLHILDLSDPLIDLEKYYHYNYRINCLCKEPDSVGVLKPVPKKVDFIRHSSITRLPGNEPRSRSTGFPDNSVSIFYSVTV